MSFPPITDAATRKALLNRKIQLESRLRQHGITDYPITHLQYLQFDAAKFASPFEVGCRLLCLCAAGFAAYGADERPAIVEWLQRENLWAHVSPREHELYDGAVTDEQQLEAFSWQEEGAYILAWALGLIEAQPDPTIPVGEFQLDAFFSRVPMIGEPVSKFLESVELRDAAEIIDENLFNEVATTCFRDLWLSGQASASDLDATVSFERHKALNWLRRFAGITEWDHTDTAT